MTVNISPETPLQAALGYATVGWPVFPCNPHDKTPLTEHGFKDATTDAATIEAWWKRWPGAMIGFPTGAVSGVLVLDVDIGEGPASLKALMAGAAMPEGLRVKTPSGGRHCYFKMPDMPIGCSTSKIGRNLDIRANGGYVVAAPSRNAAGGVYAAAGSGIPEIPSWLLAALLAGGEGASVKRNSPDEQRATIEEVRRVLRALPNDPMKPWCDTYQKWQRIAAAIKGAVGEDGLELWLEWNAGVGQRDGYEPEKKWKEAGADHIGWVALRKLAEQYAGAGVYAEVKVAEAARVFDDNPPPPPEDGGGGGSIGMGDFWAHAPSGKYIYVRNGELWPAVSVDARVPGTPSGSKIIPASVVLRRVRQVQQISWVPGEVQIIEDRIVQSGGIVECEGNRIFNKYEGPKPVVGGSAQASLPWVAHVRKVYPDDWEWILNWFAHRVQRPGEKINHALVLGGRQGVGKDTLIEPLARAVGPHNFGDVKPGQLMERFNVYKMSVVLRVNEAHDLGEGQNRVKFYNTMKTLIAAPPMMLQVEQKGIDVYNIPNVVGVIITTNYKVDGLYLPEDDRRHYVAWSNKTESDFGSAYFDGLWKWMEGGGFAHVRAFLMERDLSGFDAKAPPVKTRAFYAIAHGGRSAADDDISNVIEAMGSPEVFSMAEFLNAAPGSVHDLLKTNARLLVSKIDEAGYEKVANPKNKKGWRLGTGWVSIYASRDLSVPKQVEAVEKWMLAEAAKRREKF